MKHLDQSHVDLLSRLLKNADLEVAPSVQASLAAYLDAIIEANTTLNLTRISEPGDAVRLHLVDSLLGLPDVLESPPGALLDIGTGAGFPGVPLCVAAQRSGTLLDSVGKKANAVNAILSRLNVSAAICAEHARAEDHAHRCPQHYAVVTARAVSQLPSLVELASPLLFEGGRLVALKGAPDQSELDRGRAAAALVGMREVLVRHTTLPGGDERRCIVVYERTGGALTMLPRRPGEAQRAPLA